jgi:hypothetical protein
MSVTLCELLFCCCEKIPDKTTYRVVGIILVYGFSPWSANSIAGEVRLNIIGKEHVVEQSNLLWSEQEAEREIVRGLEGDLSCKDMAPILKVSMTSQ